MFDCAACSLRGHLNGVVKKKAKNKNVENGRNPTKPPSKRERNEEVVVRPFIANKSLSEIRLLVRYDLRAHYCSLES